MKAPNEYGLLIERINRYGTEYVEVKLTRREPDRDYPLGCSSDGESFYGEGVPKHLIGLNLDGLGMRGFVSDTDAAYIAASIEYSDVHSMDERKLRRMVKTIKKVNDRVQKDEAREPGDKFMALAAALKLSFAVERKGKPGPGTPQWRWMSIVEGRNRYRAMIEEARAEVAERKGLKVA